MTQSFMSVSKCYSILQEMQKKLSLMNKLFDYLKINKDNRILTVLNFFSGNRSIFESPPCFFITFWPDADAQLNSCSKPAQIYDPHSLIGIQMLVTQNLKTQKSDEHFQSNQIVSIWHVTSESTLSRENNFKNGLSFRQNGQKYANLANTENRKSEGMFIYKIIILRIYFLFFYRVLHQISLRFPLF